MPIRDFVCKKHGKVEVVYQHGQAPKCPQCGAKVKLLARSQEGPGHTTHVRIR